MATENNIGRSFGMQNVAIADQRRRLAAQVVRYSFLLIGALIVVLVALAIVTFLNRDQTGSPNWAIQMQGTVDRIMTAVLPLLGAWVGAIIAFYFGRENYEAAATNVQQTIQAVRPDDLESIAAREVMIPSRSLTAVRTPADDRKFLRADILPPFEAKRLGRIIVLRDGGVAVGVLHDSTVNRFIVQKVAGGADMAALTLKDLLDDAEIARLLASSAVYVGADVTLAEVKRRMEDAGSSRGGSVRDAFVTQSGAANDPVIGYLSDIDLGKHGAYK